MKLYYDSLTIEVGYELIDIAKLKLTKTINEHGLLEITFRCEKKKAEEIIERSSSDDNICLYEGKKCVFQGMLSQMELESDRFCAYLQTTWHSYTAKLDIAKKSRAYTGESMQYVDIIQSILGKYQGSFCKENAGRESIPGFILQYGETDWEFLKRLAGKEGCVLIPDNTMPSPCFDYGLTKGKSIKMEKIHGIKGTVINYEEYARREAECMEFAFLQDCYCFQVSSSKWYELGQKVEYEDKEGIIRRITVEGKQGLVEKCYEIVPEGGVTGHTGIHNDFSGLHLPATVKEVSGTKVRVDFEIEQISKGEERYFEYAVESSAWYCMPEQGSSIHIYLPENDETRAYGVHSMRNTEGGGKHAQATSDPQVKSYTHPGGGAMQLDGSQLLLTADGSGNTEASLGSDGTLGLKAKKITIYSAGNIKIGKSEHSDSGSGTPAKDVSVSSGLDISVITEKGAYAYLGEQAFLKGSIITNTAAIHDAVEIPAEILSRNDGIEDAITAINDAAKEMEKQKIQEAKQKTGMGLFAMVAGAVAIGVVGVCTGGAGLLMIGALAAGTVAIGCGASMMAEGVQDYKKAVETGDFSKSYNFVRDSLLGGNQTLYDILTYGSVLICGILVGVATGGAGLEALKTTLMRVGTEMGLDGAMNLFMDYIDDGSINNGWESYFKSMCTTGSTAGFSSGIMNKFKKLEKAGKLTCPQLSRIRLGIDVTLDSLVSFATTGEVNLAKILLQNYLANKLTLADPVDGATGSLYIPAVDMKLPDIREDFAISRKYESINPRKGILGPGWTCSLESFLQYKGDLCHILCPDGHVESFHLREGFWHNDKGGSRRMELWEEKDGYRLLDVPVHMSYVYARDDGRILYAEDGQGNRSVYEYDVVENSRDNHSIHVLTAVTTFAGGRVEVRMENGRLTGLTDVLGRTVTYTYDENGRLACINQNDRGLTRYVYDKKGNVTEITDQNNKRYTVNTFDDRGRVIGQHYPDGSSCEISYDDREKSAVFYYPETGGRQKVYHNPEHLVTRIEYQDDTYEAYGYDQWQNKTYYRDRNGNETRWEYSEYGEAVKEIQPDGLETIRTYGEPGYLTEERDSEGGCIHYFYDNHHNLEEKSVLAAGALSWGGDVTAEEDMAGSTRTGKWLRERYSYDRYGRLHYKEDANGNRTSYCYAEGHPRKLSPANMYPEMETSPEGYEYYYHYDQAGRKTKVESEGTTMEFSYNGLHHVNHVTDGEGNVTHEEYDNLGSLIRHYNHRQWMKSRNGGGYTYEYDYLDRLIRVKDPLGREKYFKRNGQGSILYESLLCKPQQIPEQGENKGLYSTYDANDNRTCTTFPDGGRWESRYDAEGNLLYEGSPLEQGGKYYEYDAMGRVTEIRLEDGTVANRYVYDRKGRLVREANALGEMTYYAYDLAGRRTGVWEYAGESGQKAGEPDRLENSGTGREDLTGSPEDRNSTYRVIQYLYDDAGNVIEERKGLEAVKPLEYPHRFLRIRKEYDSQNRLVSVEDGTGAKVTYAYDFRNNRTKETRLINEQGVRKEIAYSYDKSGRLIRKEESESGREDRTDRGEASITRYGYDEAGNLTFLRLPEGGTIRMAYDAADRPVYMLEQDKKNGICRGMSYLYDDTCAMPWEELYGREDYGKRLNQQLMECSTLEDYHGEEFLGMLSKEQPATVRYYSGKKALEIYHAYVQVYEKERVWGPGAEARIEAGEEGKDYYTRRYRYDFRGMLLSQEDTLGNRTGYAYNQAGDLVKLTAPDGSESTFAYDGQGRLLSKTNGEQEREYLLAYDRLDRVIAETDGEGNTTSYTYHSTGETSKVTGADGKTDWQTSYDIWGRPDSVTDGNGNRTTYQKDSWGRVVKVAYPDGGEEHYAHDYAGNVTKARDAVGNETEFCYNGDSRLERIKRADGSRRYFGYDREGRCSYRKDENGNTIRLSYNMDGNPVMSTGSSGKAGILEGGESKQDYTQETAVPEIKSLYTYDEQGFLKKAAEGGSVYEYERDTEGNTLRKSAGGRTLYEAAYDGCGRLEILDGTHYRYDRAGRLRQVRSGNGISAAYRYNKNGMQTEVFCGNGLRTTYGYDSRNQLTSLTAGIDGKEPLLQAVYEYDRNGNRTGKEERFQRKAGSKRAAEKTAYSYDRMDRLTGETRDGRETVYRYDLAGNRTSRFREGKEETYRYNSRNQLTGFASDDGNVRYHYDLAGNLVEEIHASITAKDKRIQYAYDSYNRNTGIRGNDFQQKNIYDAEGYRYSREENGKVTNFAYRLGMLLGELDGEGIPTRKYVPGNEYVGLAGGTGRESEAQYYVTDEQGSIRYILNGDGEIKGCYQYDAFGESIVQEGDGSRLQYNSQIWDELSGLYYLRARYYNPRTGRFTQEDISYSDGLNLYNYCNANPVIYEDWTGFAKKPKKPKKPVPFSMGEFVYEDINSINYGKHLKELIGDPPSGMYNPHAHHIVFKIGNGPRQKALAKEAQKLLASVGIDPIMGEEVLCWAPNGVKGQHTYKTLKKTVNDIKKAISEGKGKGKEERKDLVIKALNKNKKEAQNRTKSKTKCSKK